jgi:hypothetical protein
VGIYEKDGLAVLVILGKNDLPIHGIIYHGFSLPPGHCAPQFSCSCVELPRNADVAPGPGPDWNFSGNYW